MIKRFSKQMLFKIEDLKAKGRSVNQISKELKITPTDVKNGLQRIYEDEMKEE